MTVGKAIYYLLTNATDVTDVVSTRVYPEIAQQDADLPYIVYAIANNEPTDTKPEPSKLDTAQVEVNIYSQSYTECIDLAVAVRAALDRVKGTYNGVNVQSIQYLNEVIDFDEPQRAYNINADYDVRISRSGFEIAQGSPITGVELGELSDVDVTGVTNGQLIAYNSTTGNWEAADDAGGAETLDDLTDVDASVPSAGQLLAYGQDTWQTIDQDELTLPISSVTGLQTELNTIPDNIDDLDDVKIVGTPSEGEALVYTSGFWSRGTAGASTLDELDDVQVPTPSSGAVLQYNGAYWAASALSIPSVPNTYYHQRYSSEAGTLRSGATETVELYYTAQADGDGLSESASSDTPTSGYDIRRKLWYAEKAQADPDTSADWTQFTAIADNTTFNNAKAALLAYLKERTGGTVPISLKMTWEEVAQAPAFTGLLNESYGSGAEAAYSTRRLNGNVTECMVIRRASDSTTTTIGFVDGDIDESAIETFCTGTTCTVVTWKDQSGNSIDASAVTEGTIYDSGALKKINGTLYIDGGTYDASFTGSSTGHLFMTLQRPTVATPRYIATSDSTNKYYFYGYDGNTGGTSSGVTVNSYRLNGTTASSVNRDFIWDNTESQTQATVDVDDSSFIDRRLYFNVFSAPYYQEFIYYSSTKSTANRNSIESNIGDYFTQNTPLLDTYSGAAAAYSLRLLDSTYTGPAIEVYAGTNGTADIGFNVFGELDTVALAAHCGNQNGTVRTWYDQSGNGRHATQTVSTANQPKIYDASTGVITESGKPSMDMIGSKRLIYDSVILSQPLSFFTTGNNGASGYSCFFQAYNDTTNEVRLLDGASARFLSAGVNLNYTSSSNIYALRSAIVDSSNSSLHFNGSQKVTGDAGTNDYRFGRIGNLDDSSYSSLANLQELIIYESNQSSNRTNIEDNINTFYNIY